MIHIFNIIVYLVLLVINYIVYDFLHSYLNFLIFIIQIVFPFVSVYMVFLLRKKIQVKIRSFEKEIIKGEKGLIAIDINNPTVATTLFLKIKLKIKNTFLGENGEKTIDVPTYIMGTNTITLPLKSIYCGIMSVEVDEIIIRDLGGFISLKKKIGIQQEIYVFPDGKIDEDVEFGDLSQGMTEADESNKKGSDFADVNDVREYIPGDKLMNIHWKLTAKRDFLMVKERVSMSDSQLAVVVELCKGLGNRQLDDIVTLAYTLCVNLLSQNDTIKIIWWKNREYEIEEKRIETKEELKEAIKSMYFENPYMEWDLVKGLMPKVKPEIKSFVYINNQYGQAEISTVENY